LSVESLSIGQLAKSVGIGVETIRFYERQGLIEEPPRKPSGYRQYPSDAVRRLRFIMRAKTLGFSLKEINALLNLRADPRSDCGDIKIRAEQRLSQVDDKIRHLELIRRELGSLIQACEGEGSLDDCPILGAFDAGRQVRVELVFSPDCPNVSETRDRLGQALARLGLPERWVEWDLSAPNTPVHLRKYGSPTVLINGGDTDAVPPDQDGDCCRVYCDESQALSGSPSVERLVATLENSYGASPVSTWE